MAEQMNMERQLNRLLDEARRGRLSLFIGAELPRAITGLPDQRELAQALAEDFGLEASGPSPSLFTLAQQVGGQRQALIQFLIDHLDVPGISPQPFDELIARLPVDLLITTRYDDLLTRAFLQAQRPLNIVVTDLDASLRRPDRTTLVKLYGDLRQPHTLTITEDDLYDLQAQKQGVWALVEQAMSSGTALLLGYDLASPDFLALWRTVSRRLGRYAPVAYAASAVPLSAAEHRLWRERRIEVLNASPWAVVQKLAERLTPVGEGPAPQPISQPAPPPATPPVSAYRNFDLELAYEEGKLAIRVIRSPEGEDDAVVEVFSELPPPLDQTETLHGLDVEIGRRLLPGAIGERWAASLATATRAGEGLRLRLFLRDPTLAEVPWEAARVHDRWPALRPQTPIVRYVQAPRPPGALQVDGPLRLLVLLSETADIGLQPLDVGSERALLESALRPLQESGRIQIHWLEGLITRQILLDALRQWRPHLLHFVGHGFYAEAGDQGFLVLGRQREGRPPEPDPLGTTELAIMLDGSPVRFALLNACQTGRAVGGVAQALVRSALPAALGMQADVPDEAAVAFAGAFYRALADGWPVDAATVEGRRLLATQTGVDRPWWALPVLYMRSEDGHLFG